MPVKALSSLAGTVEKLKKGKTADSPPSVRQIAKQDGFLLLADALMEETQAVQTELNQWQTQRESWSRSMDRMSSEVGCRMSEVDRLRAEANSLLNAARSDATSVAKNELHSLNSRIDEMHKQAVQLRNDMQAKMNEFSTSIKACEKMSNIQQEVWELQRWRDVNNPKVQAEMLVNTVEEVIRSHTTKLLEDVAPKELREKIQNINQKTQKASMALAKDMKTIAHALQEAKTEHQSSTQASVESLQRLDDRIAQLEHDNPQAWLSAIQNEVDSINKRKSNYDEAIEEVFQTVLTEIGRLSSEMRRMDHHIYNMSVPVDGNTGQNARGRYSKSHTDVASVDALGSAGSQ